MSDRLQSVKIRRDIIKNTVKYNINLTELQLYNITKRIEEQNQSKATYKVNNIEDLKEKMKENYINVSNQRLKYYLFNFLESYNTQTKETKNNKYINGVFKYRENFDYINKSNDNNINNYNVEYKEEKNKGEFLSKQDKIYSYKKISKVMYLDYVNKEKSKIFITFTLPGSYHKYRQIKGEFVEKSKFGYNDYCGNNFEINTKNGLVKLNEMHSYFYQTLKYKLKRIKKGINVDFIKILEPQKNLMGHSHSLFYIDSEYINTVKEVYNMTIKKFELKQTDFEILHSSKASTYLNKYLLKTTKTEDVFYNQYKRYFSDIRFFSSSNFKHTNQKQIDLIYKYLYKHNKELVERLKKSDKPFYYLIEQMIINKTFEFEDEEVEILNFDNKLLKQDYINYLSDYNIKKDKKKQEKEEKKQYNKNLQKQINLCYSNLNNDNINYILDNTVIYSKSFEVKKNEKTEEDKEDYQIDFEIKQLLAKNINDYITFKKIKKITKLKRRNKVCYVANEIIFIPLNAESLENLYNNPFENEEIENILLNKYTV